MSRARRIAAVTQRVDVVERYHERRDALDQSWTRLLWELDYDLAPMPNDPAAALALVAALEPAALLLSGGNDVMPEGRSFARERNETEFQLLAWASDRQHPVVGVCRGMQMMNLHLGGALRHVEGHVGTVHAVSGASVKLSVNSYHNHAIAADDLARPLEPLLVASDGTIEAARHATLPWIGIMWHPERPIADRERQKHLLAAALQGRFDVRV